MRSIRFGDYAVAVCTASARNPEIDWFVERCSARSSEVEPIYVLQVTDGERAGLLIDFATRVVSLALPPTSDSRALHTSQIAILQAAARCLTLFTPNRCSALLHGSAVRLGDGSAVAVLDGGLGQGKTSLALALAQTGCAVLVDEFCLATVINDAVVVAPTPDLPWHVRPDMAPYLTPHDPCRRLRFPDNDACLAPGRHLRLAVSLIPDRTLKAGATVAVDAADIDALLGPAVTDHRAKLVDPRLDHVSLFGSPDQVRVSSGGRLIDDHSARVWPSAMVRALSDVPTYRVGIGEPNDIWLSTEASRRVMEVAQ